MSKQIIAVYQDCFLCGSTGEEGKKMLKAIAAKGYEFRKLSFATNEGADHCLKATESGIKRMPFFTDGKIYAQSYEALIQAESEPKKAKVKVNIQKKGKADGPITES